MKIWRANKMLVKTKSDLWKMSEIRAILFHFERGDYGDDKTTATRAALNDIISMAKEDNKTCL